MVIYTHPVGDVRPHGRLSQLMRQGGFEDHPAALQGICTVILECGNGLENHHFIDHLDRWDRLDRSDRVDRLDKLDGLDRWDRWDRVD